MAKKLKKTPEVNRVFTSNKLKGYFERQLCKDTLGGIDKISIKEFHDIMEIVGFKRQRVIFRSPHYFYNVDDMNVLEVFGSII